MRGVVRHVELAGRLTRFLATVEQRSPKLGYGYAQAPEDAVWWLVRAAERIEDPLVRTEVLAHAALAMQRGDPAEAARQLALADQLRAEIQAVVPAAERAERDQTVQAAQQALGAAYGLAALTAGLSGSGG